MMQLSKADRAGLIVGIDGGQTSTRCAVCSTGGACISYAEAPACGRIVDEIEGPGAPGRMLALVEEALQMAGAGPDDVRCLWLGMTGVPGPKSRPGVLWHEVMQSRFPRSVAKVEADIVSALHGAAGFDPGVVVLSGTGSIAIGFDGSGYARAGGWGWFLGDPGSGYAIGLSAIKAMTDSHDGTGPDTILTEAILEELGLGCVEDIKLYLYTRRVGAGEIAALSHLVSSSAAEQGDAVAQAILARAGTDLATLVISVLRRLERLARPTNIYPSGGVLSHNEAVRRALQDELGRRAPMSCLASPELPPVAGSVLLAAKECGRLPDGGFMQTLQRTLAQRCNERSRCME